MPLWIIPAIALVAVIAAVYVRFLAALPTSIRGLVMLAGALYVGGAIGGELMSAEYEVAHGHANLGYAAWVAIEEGGEMVGVAIFLYALLQYLTHCLGPVTVGARAAVPAADAAAPGSRGPEASGVGRARHEAVNRTDKVGV